MTAPLLVPELATLLAVMEIAAINYTVSSSGFWVESGAFMAAMVACKAHPNCFDRIPRSTNNPSFSRNRLHVQDRRRVYFHLRESERMSFPEISLITTGVKGKHSTIFEGIEALVTEVSRETEQARV